MCQAAKSMNILNILDFAIEKKAKNRIFLVYSNKIDIFIFYFFSKILLVFEGYLALK